MEFFTYNNQYFQEQYETATDIENMLPYVKGSRLCRYAAKDENAVAVCEQKIAESQVPVMLWL